MSDINELAKVLKQIKQDISAIKVQNTQIIQQNSDVKEELQSFKKEITEEFEKLKSEKEQLQAENVLLKSKLQDIERKYKKYNLVFYGVQEKNKENLIVEIIEILNSKLELQLETHCIRDAYRIGKIRDNIIRPIVVELTNYTIKSLILRRTGKLKGTSINISYDYNAEDYLKQKYIASQLKVERQKGHNAKIRGTSLIIDGTSFSYEDLKKREQEEVEATSCVDGNAPEKSQTKENRKILRSNVKIPK